MTISRAAIEEFLLTDRTALAVCLFLFDRKSKSDLSELEAAFGVSSVIRNQVSILSSMGLVETFETRSTRVQISELGRDLISNFKQAANQFRRSMIEHSKSRSLNARSGGMSITSVSPLDLRTELGVDLQIKSGVKQNSFSDSYTPNTAMGRIQLDATRTSSAAGKLLTRSSSETLKMTATENGAVLKQPVESARSSSNKRGTA